MRQTLNILTWAFVITTVTTAFWLSSPPDDEAMLGIPGSAPGTAAQRPLSPLYASRGGEDSPDH